MLVLCLLSIATVAQANMSMSKVRENTRFLTDRMRYELNLSYNQYNDVYEVNFDYVNNSRRLMPYVVRGDEWAIADYYRILDVRNDDLRWILSSRQYARFMGMDYFFRPIYATGNVWNFRVYLRYKNVSFFYFSAPGNYHSYNGGHYRTHYNNVSYYKTHYAKRYTHPVYDRYHSTRHDKVYADNCRHDFGHKNPPRTKPGEQSRPNKGGNSFHIGKGNNSRPGTSKPGNGSNQGNSNTSRPSGNKPDVKPGNNSRPGTSKPGNGLNQGNSNTSRPSGNKPDAKPGSNSRPGSSTSTGKNNNNVTTRPAGTQSGRSTSARGTKEKTPARSSSSSSTTSKEQDKVNKRSYYGNAEVEKRASDNKRR